jgi:hypothetical protein
MKSLAWIVTYRDDAGQVHQATIKTIEYLKAILARYSILKVTEVED